MFNIFFECSFPSSKINFLNSENSSEIAHDVFVGVCLNCSINVAATKRLKCTNTVLILPRDPEKAKGWRLVPGLLPEYVALLGSALSIISILLSKIIVQFLPTCTAIHTTVFLDLSRNPLGQK